MCLAALALPLTACEGPSLATVAPRSEAAQDFVIAEPVPVVYERLRGYMAGCKVIHNLLFPARLEGGIAPGEARGRLYVVRGSGEDERTLWGADIAAVEAGTRVVTFANPGSSLSSSRVYHLMRGWAHGTYEQTEFSDC